MDCLIVSVIASVLFWFDIISSDLYIALVAGSIVWMYVGSWLYFKFGFQKFYYHGLLGWHTPDDFPQQFDGCSIHATCKYCGKKIMQDGQGNWFSFD